MKKLIFLFVFCLGLIAANAQSVTPRVGTGANNDNTYRALTFKFYSATDATGADTVKLTINAYNYAVSVPALKDSLAFTFPSVASCYLGDQLTISAIGLSGSKIKFVGSNFVVASSSMALSTGLTGLITFRFNGAKWVEVGRAAY